MKRLICILLTLLLLPLLCGCSRTDVPADAPVTLTFIYGTQNIQTRLTDEEAQKVIAILDGNSYDEPFSIPACGFDENISLTVGSRVYAIACDTCNCVLDLGNLRFFDISEDSIAYIHSLFEKYGGHFPCV